MQPKSGQQAARGGNPAPKAPPTWQSPSSTGTHRFMGAAADSCFLTAPIQLPLPAREPSSEERPRAELATVCSFSSQRLFKKKYLSVPPNKTKAWHS